MNKSAIIQQIILQLEDSLSIALASANAAHETATHEESVAENKYDTFGLEASYLADGLSRQVSELKAAIQTYRNACFRDISDGVVRLGALVTLELDADGQCLNYFLGPAGGGINVVSGDWGCKVITPNSPLGQALVGKEIDDEVALLVNGAQQIFYLVEVK
ncbi:GreA/GreB family elongation factor [Hahella ganghwensis]|uniref:GreA/GreB family elongation factor n=1 Tax=Hahella ganghwensis TaxID=286420 RepID=UPI000373226B|nr:GreA/GreB family elongation factor [Hahella ganghwensis]